MQNQNRPIRTGGRSSIDRLPSKLREAVDQAIADGATIDDITALIRAEGGSCSRSAVGRYSRNLRALIREQQEFDRAMKIWVRELGERAEGRAGLILIETLRTMVLSTMAELSQRGEPAPMRELARLALTLKHIEGTDKLRLERERTTAKAARVGGTKPQSGLSPETAAAIRAEVEGRPPPRPRTVTSVPVDPRNLAESRPIPDKNSCLAWDGRRERGVTPATNPDQASGSR